MPKQIGRNASLLIMSSACTYSPSNSMSLTGDLNSITVTYNEDAPEVSVFGAINKERMFDGIRDWELGFEGYYEQQAAGIDETLFNLLGGSCMIDYGLLVRQRAVINTPLVLFLARMTLTLNLKTLLQFQEP
jgi:hypothetical protein